MSDPRGRLLRHDPLSRDFPAQVAPLRNVAWPTGPTLNQDDLGGCPGWAGGNVRNSLMLMKYGPQARLLGDRECAAIYSRATLDDPFDGCWPPTDTGSSGLGAARAMKQLGLIGGYRHAFGLQHALGALCLQPVMIGIPWPDSMMKPDSRGLLTVDEVTSETPGHEIEGCAIDVDNRLVVLFNQWTDEWGLHGKAAMHWDDFDRLLDAQGDVTVPVLA